MNLKDLNKVWEIKALKMPREKEARDILERVAKQVQPIMRNRHWKVNLLSEFCPSNPALLGLNVNGGEEVKLRLRRPNNESDFFPYDQILDTMLHELCHNQHGPHDALFYNLLDDIRKECEQLMAKGITGTAQGFDLPGKRLGGFARQPPLSSLRHKALAAAETRLQRGSLLPSGPNRLGGDTTLRDVLTPIQAAAMAAERRLHDDLWCSSRLDDPSVLPQIISSAAESTPVSKQEANASWQCGACTLLNGPLNLTCEACETQRTVVRNENASTSTSTNTNTNTKTWSCKFCTLQNPVAMERCLACGEWKYSYGPPTTTRGPYLGT